MFADIAQENMLNEFNRVKMQQYAQEALNFDINPVICERNIPLKDFYLLLSGNVTICSGMDCMLTDMKFFEYIGSDSLLKETYIPDFSAKVINHAKLLKISKKEYTGAISDIKNIK